MTREDAKVFMRKEWRECMKGSFAESAFEMAIDALEQPERKKGQWIPEFNGMFKGGAYWFKCSECERIVPEVRNGGWNYCPNCGADMTEGKG